MAKVKESQTIKDVSILWYCDDETGYGVELLGEESEIADFTFGQDKDGTAEDISYNFFNCLLEIFENDSDEAYDIVNKLYLNKANVKILEAFVDLYILAVNIHI